MTRLTIRLIAHAAVAAVIPALAAAQPPAQQATAPGGREGPGPTITVQGRTFTQQSLFQRVQSSGADLIFFFSF